MGCSQAAEAHAPVAEDLWTCASCGESNRKNRNQCNNCGEGHPTSGVAMSVSPPEPLAAEAPLTCPTIAKPILDFRPEELEFPAQVVQPRFQRDGKADLLIGIDLGTYNCCVSCLRCGEDPEPIPNESGLKLTPSYVAFTDSGVLVGEDARKQATRNPKNTLFSTKRLIGRQFADKAVQTFIKEVPFDVVEKHGRPAFSVECMGRNWVLTTQEVSALILMKLKHIAEVHLGTKIVDAVLTVPANFNEEERAEARSACFIAGLNPLRILSEPIAASLCCMFEATEGSVWKEKETTVIVVDLGGGTLDVTLVNLEDGICEIVAVAGDMSFGGDDFDTRIMHHVVEEFQRKHQKDISGSARAMQSLRLACEQAKRDLSTLMQTNIHLPYGPTPPPCLGLG